MYLVFEGEYLFDKKWSGKGYDINENIIYEILNETGKIKVYDKYNNLIEDSEYLNGKRNWKIKEYYSNGKLKFEAEYLNGKKWNGISYDKYKEEEYKIKNWKEYIIEYNEYEEKIFEGECLNRERNGKGN